MSGGNIDVSFIHKIIEIGLVARQRKLKFRATLLDKPGSLTLLSQVVADCNANIIQVQYDRMNAELEPNQVIIHIGCEVGGKEHGEKLIKSLEAHGFEVELE